MIINEEQVAEASPEQENPEQLAAPVVDAEATTSDVTPAAPAAPTAVESAPASAPESGSVQVADDLDLFEAAMAEMDSGSKSTTDSYRRLSKGDRVVATVIQVTKDRVFVDLGTKSEGVVPLNELTESNVDTAEGLVNVGDKINVVVIKPEGGDGGAIVSKKRADFDAAWDRVVDAFQSGEMVSAQVVDRVKGGLVVDVGVRGFVPATHVGSGNLRNIDKFVGTSLELKVIEIDKERKKVVLSNREAEEKRRDDLKENLFSNINMGDVVEGSVRRLTDYGAFVDLGGIDGLLHISEMSWMRINHPKEVLKEGQKIKVMVLRLDKDTGKISLGLRQVLPDPWKLIQENYKVGQKLNCTISRMVQSGAFVRLPEEAEAFLPLSEISHRRISKPQDVLAENQEVELTIIDLRPDERRMVLSLRSGTMPEQQIGYGYGAPGANDFDASDRNKPRGDRKSGPRGKKKGGRDDYEGGQQSRGAASGGATIGERLGMLKGFHFRSDEETETKTEESGEGTGE